MNNKPESSEDTATNTEIKDDRELVTLDLSPEVIEYFRSTGKGWHSRINKILLDHVRQG